jgi:membrane protein implicated in regulation of membrane protease activity
MMSRKYLSNAVAGVVISLAITLVVFNIFKVSPEEILSLNPSVLVIAVVLNLVRFGAQGLRLHLLLRRFGSIQCCYRDSFIVRSASEFFALTTIPFMADEAARAWLLVRRGEQAPKAFWVSFTEMLLDTLVGAAIALAAGLYALAAGTHYLSLVILLISSIQLLMVAVFLWVARKPFKPSERSRPEENTGTTSLFNRLWRWLVANRDGMGQVFRPLFSRPMATALVWLMLSTMVVMTAPALILYLMLDQSGLIWFTASLFTFHAGNALGVIPVTVGGAGLTEAGLYLYLRDVLGNDAPSTVIQWRLATYHLSLIISGVTLAVAVAGMRRTRR